MRKDGRRAEREPELAEFNGAPFAQHVLRGNGKLKGWALRKKRLGLPHGLRTMKTTTKNLTCRRQSKRQPNELDINITFKSQLIAHLHM